MACDRGRRTGPADVRMKKGKMVAGGQKLDPPAGKADPSTTIIDARGKLVLPGLVDLHVHLREPGFEYKDTIQTGTAAAVAGGVNSVFCKPETSPVHDNQAVNQFIPHQAPF